MRHSHLNKRKAFDFIATELEQGRQVSDQQLQDLCCFFEREHVKTLLADLADEGAISVTWDGPVRTIALGPKERAKVHAPRPVPTIVRPAVLRQRQRRAALDEESATARIMSIMKGRPVAQPKRDAVSVIASADQPPENPSIAPTRATCETLVPHGAGGVQVLEPRGAAEEGGDSPQVVKAHPTSSKHIDDVRPGPKPRAETRTKQVSTLVFPSMYDRISHAAIADGVTMSTKAFQLLEEACAARECGTDRRHRLSASVLRAWRGDGRPLAEFVTWLIELGLEEHGRILAHAEAAE